MMLKCGNGVFEGFLFHVSQCCCVPVMLTHLDVGARSLEVADEGWTQMVLLPLVRPSTACACPSGFNTITPPDDTCMDKQSLPADY